MAFIVALFLGHPRHLLGGRFGGLLGYFLGACFGGVLRGLLGARFGGILWELLGSPFVGLLGRGLIWGSSLGPFFEVV